MQIAITGASGLIGTALREALEAEGHRPLALVRRSPRPGTDEIHWDPATGQIDGASLEGTDAVVHLAGAGIGDKRWSEARKKIIRDSRIDGTRLLAETLASLGQPPSVLISGSAIGFYGSRGDEVLDEGSGRGSGFLADVTVDWEAAAEPARAAGIRTILARTGIVLTPRGGALKRQLPLFKLGLGGRFGSGTQWLGWISLDDHIRATMFLLDSAIDGPVNLTTPEPVTNAEFTETLGGVLRRPTLIPVPLIGPKLLFGSEMVSEMLLASQRAVPQMLLDAGFVFDHATLEPALRSMLGK